MNKPKFISKSGENKTSLDYDKLRSLGISHIERFSGNQWTDYNYHDPGITLLEQLCYAITDLAYRTDFSITDILQHKVDDFDLAQRNLLHSEEEVFATSPMTLDDYRILLLDKLSEVQNVWVNPVRNNPLGIKGLFEVQIQLKEGVSESQTQHISEKIHQIFYEDRSIGTDLERIIILEKDEISLSGNIYIDSFAVGEDILSTIYFEIHKYLNQERSISESKTSEQPNHYKDNLDSESINKDSINIQLKDRVNEIYISEILSIINETPGVIDATDLTIYKNGVKCFEDIITFNENRFPSLFPIQQFDKVSHSIKIFRNNYEYDIDKTILIQLYEAQILEQIRPIKRIDKNSNDLKKGRFSSLEIENYYSIQNELPSIYGLKKNELPKNSTKRRVAQAKQLKGYLLLFEQLMANHLGQLSNIRKLYSVDEKDTITYYNQIPDDIANLEDVISNKDIESYKNYLKEISCTEKENLERKHKFIDHLIARYGEYYDTSVFEKLNPIKENNSHLKNSLQAKMRYARNLISLGYERNKGENLNSTSFNTVNMSGLQKRIELILDIKPKQNYQATQPLFNDHSDISDLKKNWVQKDLQISKNKSLKILSIEDENYSSNHAEYYCRQYKDLQDIFLSGQKISNYSIHKSDSLYILLFKSAGNQYPTKIYQSKSLKQCEEKLRNTTQRIKDMNQQCEGMYLVENVLLRPNLIDKYHIQLSQNEKGILQSVIPKNIEYFDDKKENFIILCQNKDNYSITKNPDDKRFYLSIYNTDNEEILRSIESFKNKEKANESINTYIDNFSNQQRVSQKLNWNYVKSESISHEFPEDFNYSNHIHFVLPDWPYRFQNKDFRDHIKASIERFTPAHLKCDITFLTVTKMKNFESIYLPWRTHLRSSDKTKTENYSLQLIQLLKSFK